MRGKQSVEDTVRVDWPLDCRDRRAYSRTRTRDKAVKAVRRRETAADFALSYSCVGRGCTRPGVVHLPLYVTCTRITRADSFEARTRVRDTHRGVIVEMNVITSVE